jgi:hypothetical protein
MDAIIYFSKMLSNATKGLIRAKVNELIYYDSSFSQYEVDFVATDNLFTYIDEKNRKRDQADILQRIIDNAIEKELLS